MRKQKQKTEKYLIAGSEIIIYLSIASFAGKLTQQSKVTIILYKKLFETCILKVNHYKHT